MSNTNNRDEEAIIRQQQQNASNNRRKIFEDWQRLIARHYPGSDTRDLIEKAWAAGFFDGEGHVSAGTRNGDFNCEIDQVDPINLERFRTALSGVGEISPRKWNKRGNEKPRFRWKITNQADLAKVWKAVGLFLTPAKQSGFASALSVPLRTLLSQDEALPEGAVSVDVPGRARPKKSRL